MSAGYQAVGWNRQKRVYDLTGAALLVVALAAYGAGIAWRHPETTAETFLLRFTALVAIVLLHLILAIGPLCRLDQRFLPFLYNRRHLGVTLFFFALFHGALTIFQFHAVGNLHPLVSVITAYASSALEFFQGPAGVAAFPFEWLGLGALSIFFFMAATSHDFWLKHLGAPVWKRLHQLVYLAYGLVVAHVLLGAIQSERSLVYPALLGIGVVGLTLLHGLAWQREHVRDRAQAAIRAEGFELVGRVDELEENTGRVIVVGGERLALYLKNGRLYALSNACRHQGGPLGEGRILYDCVTCPWHGYQYRAEDGCSPPPFTEIVPTYPVRVLDGQVYVSPQAIPLQTVSAGESVQTARKEATAPFYIGWQDRAAEPLRAWMRCCVVILGVGLACLFAVIALVQNPVDVGTYEFGVTRTFYGTLRLSPLPFLRLESNRAEGGENLPLVGAGKFGPPSMIHSAEGKKVRFKGSLIYRGGQRLIEMNSPETLEILGTGAPSNPVEDLGSGTFTGELVDTKCYFGVMRPATGKIHRGCAIRCLSGGVPPGLLVRDSDGNGVVYLLAGEADQPLDFDPSWAALVVKVDGRLELHNGTPVLRVKSLKR